MRPVTEDPLYRNLLSISSDMASTLSKCNRLEKMNFKLKTRLLMKVENSVASRCGSCHAILIQKYAPPDTVHVIEKYNPEDSQSLMVQYCNILKNLQDISPSENVIEYIEVSTIY